MSTDSRIVPLGARSGQYTDNIPCRDAGLRQQALNLMDILWGLGYHVEILPNMVSGSESEYIKVWKRIKKRDLHWCIIRLSHHGRVLEEHKEETYNIVLGPDETISYSEHAMQIDRWLQNRYGDLSVRRKEPR